jgi:DNA-binding IclR family transcriptional regulator
MAGDKKNLVGIRRTFELIELVSQNKSGLSFSAIQKNMNDLPGPTLTRLLKVAVDEKWMTKTEGLYYPGSKLMSVCRKLTGSVQIEDIMGPIVKELAVTCEESAAYAEFAEDAFVFKVKNEQPASYHHIDINTKNRGIFYNGYGIVCLAFQRDKILSLAPDDIDIKEFKKQVKKILKDHYFISREPRLGTRFLAPVFGKNGAFKGVIGISVIKNDLTDIEQKFYLEKVIASASKANAVLADI